GQDVGEVALQVRLFADPVNHVLDLLFAVQVVLVSRVSVDAVGGIQIFGGRTGGDITEFQAGIREHNNEINHIVLAGVADAQASALRLRGVGRGGGCQR